MQRWIGSRVSKAILLSENEVWPICVGYTCATTVDMCGSIGQRERGRHGFGQYRCFGLVSKEEGLRERRDHAVISHSRMESWRNTLPDMKETAEMLKRSQNKSNPSSSDCTSMDWKALVKITREAYAMEKSTVSFRDYLLDTSLEDTHGRRHSYLRISLTEKCNLRCLYCMPEDGVELTPKEHVLTVDEITRLTTLFALSGVTKVRLTGGEPTIRRDLTDIVERVSGIPGIKDVGITSNGITLAKSLEELKNAGLSLLNLSLDTLRADRFEHMTRRKGHARVLKTIDTALDIGYDPVKVNVVVMKGVNDDEISDFVELTRNKNVNVRFIEYMPFDGNVWSTDKLVSYKEMKQEVEKNHTTLERCTDGYGEVAKNYRIPGYKGSVSFVTSMTSAFCSDCTRVRLMADGNLKVCLFGNNEVSLRDAMREGATDDDLLAVISAAVNRKKAAHAGMNILYRMKNRPMVKIGG